MKAFRLDIERYQNEGEVFPPPFDMSSDCLYHGTCSSLCEILERDGLQPAASGISRADCESVAAVFDELNWSGHSLGGAPSLRSFSIEHDLSHPRGDPLFLADEAEMASCFATPTYAGGEKASAIRKAMSDLHRLIDDPSFRHQNAANPERLRNSNLPSMLAEAETLARLESRLRALATLRAKCQRPFDEFRHGVVYAIRLDTEFRQQHCEVKGGIVRVFSPIPPASLVAKVYLPPGFKGR